MWADMASRLILVTGGARSGKSGYALERAEVLAGTSVETAAKTQAKDRVFIATSPVTDPEMAERIARHQEERRGRGWRLIEEETDLPAAIGRAELSSSTQADPAWAAQSGLADAEFSHAGFAHSGHGVILIDCLTLWINNLLYQAQTKGDLQGEPFADADMDEHCERLIAACRQHDGAVLLVTNEVGMGIVPENTLARHYRDLIGRANRRLAAAADEVVFVCCGIPLTIKSDFHESA